jgi:hypothetical protein
MRRIKVAEKKFIRRTQNFSLLGRLTSEYILELGLIEQEATGIKLVQCKQC